MTTEQRLRVLIEAVIARHQAAAIDELTRALDDEIEACVCDRVADLRQQLERGDNK
jgi:ABC-type dipeptide/oligopeptide/nickel transport system ATPase component